MITAIPTLKDNYSYIIEEDLDVIIVDPGEARPIIEIINHKGITPTKIMLTHKHNDHTGGIKELIETFKNLTVVDNSKKSTYTMRNKNTIEILQTPGHTKDSYCLYLPNSGVLFSGDTLFVGICGRVIDGTYNDMFKSLQLISQLPKKTKLYPGHEYLSNALNFLDEIKIDSTFYNTQIKRTHPSLHSTIEDEIKNNPFLTTNFERFKDLRMLKG